MINTECQYPRFLLLTVFLGALFLFLSCGQSLESHLERGEQFLAQRSYEAAVMQFRAAADIDETSGAAQWGLARAYEKQEKFLETIEALRRVSDLSPDNLEAKAKLGNYYLLFNPPQIQEAERILDNILKQDKDYIEAHILRATLFSINGRSEAEVVSVLRHAIGLDKKRTESYLALSRYYMKIDKADAAESTILEAIKVTPKRALGYIEYGRFLTYSGKSEEAEEQFLKAVKVEPENIDAGLAAASFYVTRGLNKKAEQQFKNLVATQANSLESRMDLGNFYRLTGRDNDAIAVFEQILAELEEYALARYALAGIYLENRDFAKVNNELEKLLAVNDQDGEALILRAKTKLAESQPEAAVTDLENVLKKQPSERDGLFYMTKARLEMGQIDQARAFIGDLEKYHPNFRRTALLRIQAAFAVNDVETARREADELVQRTSRVFPADIFKAQKTEQLRINGLSSRGIAYLQLGRLDDALEDLAEVVRISSKSAAAKVNLARVYLARQDVDKAEELYAEALKLEPKNFDALSGLANLLNRRRDFARATSTIDRAMKGAGSEKSLTAALHFLKSEVYSAEGKRDAAEGELRKSIETDENYLPAYSAFASLLISRQQTEEALKQYRRVLEKKPSASVYTLIGMLEDGRGKYDEAEKNYRKALEMNPETPIAANNLAWLIADTGKGNLDEAMRLSRDVIKMNPGISGYFDTLGWVYLKKGFKDQAVEQFRKAVALDSSDARREGRATNSGYRLRLG
ncbi:MAG: tetratricopeptide repeat protein, partial [Acidobacteriota bacterium]|nr:tetratricopeptide repeat protein [Acidobacteriota bacterium]